MRVFNLHLKYQLFQPRKQQKRDMSSAPVSKLIRSHCLKNPNLQIRCLLLCQTDLSQNLTFNQLSIFHHVIMVAPGLSLEQTRQFIDLGRLYTPTHLMQTRKHAFFTSGFVWLFLLDIIDKSTQSTQHDLIASPPFLANIGHFVPVSFN